MIFVNTRQQDRELSHALTSLGCTVIDQNLLDILAYPKEHYEEDLKNRLTHSNKIIFTSPNAASCSLKTFQKFWDLRQANLMLIAIGSKTAEALTPLDAKCLLPESDFRSEGVLALAEMQSISGESITIITAPGGRSLLQKTLLDRGANVEEIYVYERTYPKQVKSLPFDQQLIIICSSAEAMDNFFKLYPKARQLKKNQLKWLVSSDRLRQHAIKIHHIAPESLHQAKNAASASLLSYVTKEFL